MTTWWQRLIYYNRPSQWSPPAISPVTSASCDWPPHFPENAGEMEFIYSVHHPSYISDYGTIYIGAWTSCWSTRYGVLVSVQQGKRKSNPGSRIESIAGTGELIEHHWGPGRQRESEFALIIEWKTAQVSDRIVSIFLQGGLIDNFVVSLRSFSTWGICRHVC